MFTAYESRNERQETERDREDFQREKKKTNQIKCIHISHQPHIVVIECHTGMPDLNLCIHKIYTIGYTSKHSSLGLVSLVSSYSIFNSCCCHSMEKIGFCFFFLFYLIPFKSVQNGTNKCEWHKQTSICGRVSATATTFANSFCLRFSLSLARSFLCVCLCILCDFFFDFLFHYK